MNEFDMLQHIEGLPPEEREEFIAALFSNTQAEGEFQDAQIANANQLRSRGNSQGVQVGNQFVASSPWSNVARGVERGVGEYQRMEALQAKKEAAKRDIETQRIIAELRLKGSGNQPQNNQRGYDPQERMSINAYRNNPGST